MMLSTFVARSRIRAISTTRHAEAADLCGSRLITESGKKKSPGHTLMTGGVKSNLLFGFFCDVDGDDTLTVDHEELSVAQWFDRDKIIGQDTDSSLTNEMMMVFAAGKEPK